MKKVLRKIRSKRGETFAEILIAILVVAFGCLLIATMYSSAMSINLRAAQSDKAYYDALSEMEQPESGTPESGSVEIADGEGGTLTVPVDIYGNENSASYERKK